MTEPFVTVAESRKLTGKSESTIKRLVREIVADASHPDRTSIQPSHDEVEQLRASKQQYVWQIDPALLMRRFPPSPASGAANGVRTANQPAGDLVIHILQQQLQSKDLQIRSMENQLDRKDEQIANQNERQRETNILMKELQQRLALAPPVRTNSETATVVPSSKTAPRPGILQRLFGR